MIATIGSADCNTGVLQKLSSTYHKHWKNFKGMWMFSKTYTDTNKAEVQKYIYTYIYMQKVEVK